MASFLAEYSDDLSRDGVGDCGLQPRKNTRLMALFGTRPETIKMAPIVAEIARRSCVDAIVCVTAQHRDLLDQELEMFGIVPDYDLDVMRSDQTPLQVAARILTRLEPVLERVRPDWLLVQGDTTSAMAAALTAFHCRIPVGHVEAGLRTFNNGNPFPEEANRRMVSIVADLHFAPTELARCNLLREAISPEAIRVTGNTGIDAFREMARRPYNWAAGPLQTIPRGQRLILVTAHRRESWGEPLESICLAARTIATSVEDVHVVFPVHPNPNVYATVWRILGDCRNVTLLPPLDYQSFVQLIGASYLLLTDSGGLQEEAPTLGKPVLVLRDETERPEGVVAGVARLVGTDRERIQSEAIRLLADDAAYSQMARSVSLYGDGRAAGRIVDALLAATPSTPSASPPRLTDPVH
ncbi:MAG: UDP-N-acetylglucosamine 2-epimerase (non-hydrolyzing) [Acidimicrobiales bacterium]|jgi:UDP-N-acetylglucosamine 2-epimerase (non-hydrolysing)